MIGPIVEQTLNFGTLIGVGILGLRFKEKSYGNAFKPLP